MLVETARIPLVRLQSGAVDETNLMRRGLRVALLLILVLPGIPIARAYAHNGDSQQTDPGAIPSSLPPTSQGGASIVTNELDVGVSGVYQPIAANTIPSGGPDPTPPRNSGLTTATAPPEPAACTPGSAQAPTQNTLAHKQNLTIYPSFTRNASGGYDGSDPAFGYYRPNAIPAGGDPSQTQLGAPATAANIAGHIIGVPVTFNGVSTPDGSCFVGDFTFGQPFLARDNPVPPPSPDVLATPPFAVGTSLLAELMGHWRLGTIETLPGPGGTMRTFVHIPTCAWLDSTVPLAPAHLHAIKIADSHGATLFLVYNLTVTPQPVTWDWGDDTQTTSLDASEAPPPTLPTYDASAQTWSDPCTVSHQYSTVSAGRTITATEPFSVDITVSWSDGVKTNRQSVPCDHATGGACQLTVGPAQGWESGPHPVDQIEPVPFNPSGG